MTCDDRRAEFAAYLDDELAPAERAELDTHLEGCAACQAALESERQLSRALNALPPLDPPANFEAHFWARIAREHAAPGARLGWFSRRRFALALGSAAALAAAALLFLRGGSRNGVETEFPIVASERDLQLLEDPDLELIELVDLLLAMEGDQG